eukprot:gene10093-11124_t
MAPPVGVNDDLGGEKEGRRSRRERKGPSKAQKALEKIRKYRETGERSSYEVEDKHDLYDVVDENQYAKIVRQRQQEDWIVDDDGSGYIDDGREIFDDDLTEEPQDIQKKKKEKQSASKSKVNSNKITNLFMTKAKKKKEEDVSINNDDVLDDILQSIQTSGPSESSDRKSISRKTPKRPTSNLRIPRRLQTVEPESYTSIKLKSHKMDVARLKNKKELSVTRKPDEIVDPDIDVYDVGDDLDADNAEALVGEKHSELSKDTSFNEFDSNIDMGDDIDILEIEEEEKSLKKKEEEEVETSQDSGIHCTWEEILQKGQVEDDKELFKNVTVEESSSLPLQDVDGEKVLRMFWLDAYEDNFHQPGTVYLFGKVFLENAKTHVSCCVTVKNIERRLFVLPRKFKLDKDGKETEEEVTMKDVYEEFNNVASKLKIMSFKCKPCKMKYAFELADVPSESDYLEVIYSAEQPQLSKDLHGKTFSRVFSTNTSSLELFLVSRKLKGPSWIDIRYPQVPKQNVSWCKVEAVASKPEFIEVVAEQAPAPPLILGVTGLIQSDFYIDKAAPKNCFNHCFSFVAKPTEHVLPYDFATVIKNEKRQIQTFTSERSLLGLLLARFQMIDPDVIVGHDVVGFDFDVLLHRINANKVPHWSKIGRLKRQTMPKLSGSHGPKASTFGDKNTTCGRLICDTKISAKELMRCKSYDLTELSRVILNNIREEIDVDEVPAKMRTSKDLLQLLDITTMDALYSLKIIYELNNQLEPIHVYIYFKSYVNQALPLAYQITGLCGNVMSRTLQGGRSERNEFLLLHAFAKEGYICPDKIYTKKPEVHFTHDDEGQEKPAKGKPRKKPQYAGGLVLEPKKGLYDKFILLLDFNSLYPSIIQEFNICFTTVNRQLDTEGESDIPEVPDSGLPAGILPTEIRKLVERRKQVKQMMKSATKDTEIYLQYDIRQKALKLTANSMYGCLGFSHSRFYAKPLAAMVTMKGRDILMKTKDLVQALNLDVIYGDTDSIMINTNSTDFDEVFKIGNKVKSEVNKLYKLLEIDIDGIFKSMLLLKKKKYAAVAIQKLPNGEIVQTRELKGLDIVRRDWCDLAKEAGIYVINQILSCQSCDVIVENIHDYLIKIKEKVQSNGVSTKKFQIAKALSKAPEEYPDKKSLPHVTVAQRLISQGKRVAVGDTINYIVCDDGSSLAPTQRAYHPDEYLKSSTLKIANQVHPVISRLVDPIEGTNPAVIAECLGLDASNYSSRSTHHSHDSDSTMGIKLFMTDEERFHDVEKFMVFCKNESCKIFKEEVEFLGSFHKEKNPWICAGCNTNYNPITILNLLTIFMQQKINLYYQGWVACDDPTCAKQTRLIRLTDNDERQPCSECKSGHLRVVYSDAQLYNQLYYLQKLFSGRAEHIGTRGNLDQKKFDTPCGRSNADASVEELQMEVHSTSSR